MLADGTTERIDAQGTPAALAPEVGILEKARRGVLVLAGLGIVGAGVALAPYLALLVLSLLVWILRSGSMAASSAGVRRQTRGIKWYDGVQVLLAAPWHAVAAIPGALVLVLWSAGVALAAALLCFAVGTSMPTGLGIVGVVLGAATWWGPGSRRLRSPVQRVTYPLSSRPLVWFFAAVLGGAAASGLGAAVTAQGPSWAPDDSRPFAELEVPTYLQP